jgi:hypothetical protein
MTTVVHTSEYYSITNAIDGFLSSGKMALVNIFTDSTGTTYAKDAHGNDVDSLQVTSITITESYVDPKTNETVTPSLEIKFNNGSYIISRDGIEEYWYTIDGSDMPLRSVN